MIFSLHTQIIHFIKTIIFANIIVNEKISGKVVRLEKTWTKWKTEQTSLISIRDKSHGLTLLSSTVSTDTDSKCAKFESFYYVFLFKSALFILPILSLTNFRLTQYSLVNQKGFYI